MATVTLYVSSRKDDTKLTCAITGQVKKEVKSKLDDSIGFEHKPLPPKTFLARGETVHQQLQAIKSALKHFEKLGCNTADRCFLWSTGEKDIVDLINQNDCEKLQAQTQEADTKETIHELYALKNAFKVRIGWQDSNKKNRFVDQGKSLIGDRQSKLPTWENALAKARNNANG